LADLIRSLRNHGQGIDRYDNVRIGMTGRLDTIQAAVLIEKLKIFPEEIVARGRIARRYNAALADVVRVPHASNEHSCVWAQYTIRVSGGRRDALAAMLRAQGIPTAQYYPVPSQRQGAYRGYPVAERGPDAAKLFGDRIFMLLLASQIVLLLLALIFTPVVIELLAPGFRNDPTRFDLAVTLTRITFPYLLLMALVTLFSGILNSVERFAAAAAAPVLLNLTMVATLLTAAFFPTPGHAAAWGVLLAGLFEVALVGGAALRADVMTMLRRPRLDDDVKRFFKALGPATIGSAGVQLALFADTIIASFLAAGALSALYYADRLYQLPGGVIGIAVGTVLLPEMARRI